MLTSMRLLLTAPALLVQNLNQANNKESSELCMLMISYMSVMEIRIIDAHTLNMP